MKKRASIILNIVGGLMLAPLLLLVLVQTSPGKSLLAAALNRMLSSSEHRTVQIGKISGWIPAAVEIDRLEIGDAEGVWLAAEGMHCRWMIWELLEGRIRLERLGAEFIELRRLPKAGTSASSLARPPRDFMPVDLALDDLEIGRLRLGDVEGRLSARVKSSDGILELWLDADRVDAATNPYSISVAAAVSNPNGQWMLDLHALDIECLDGVEFSLAGSVSPNRLALEGSLAEFDLRHLPVPGISNFMGRVGGAFSVAGSLKKPEIRAELDGRQFASAQAALDELPELNFHMSGELAEGRAQGTSVLTNSTTGRLAIRFQMPCLFSLDPFLFDPDPGGIHAAVLAEMDLGTLNQLALFSDQRIAGKLTAELAYHRGLSGFVRVEQGAYEHFEWGVVVRDMALDLAASNEGLRVETATATDGDAGRISLTGGMGLDQLAFLVHLDQAAIVKRDDVESTLSGQLNIGGRWARPRVTGELVVDRADILIDHIAPALPSLLTDYDAHSATQAVAVVEEVSPLPFGLDVRVDLADQIFINASMIDSVWGGNLRVRDVPQGLSVRGAVIPKRGHVSFIGKKFRFTDGQVDLDGAVPAAPSMNRVTAEYSRSDFTARLILSGRLDNPDFRLESTPAMPQDEVLSHVLFDRDTSSISPYQAFQIASAARQLSGGMNGPGFMYQMRQAVGVDTLEFREGAAEGDASSVAAGKYLTSAFYVELNRSLDEKGGMGMMAEYEVTKHFSIETSTGPQMRPGIGVNWKNDY